MLLSRAEATLGLITSLQESFMANEAHKTLPSNVDKDIVGQWERESGEQ